MQFWALIVDSFRESLDRKIFWVLVALSMLMTATMVCVGIESDRITFFFGLWEVETDRFNPFSGQGRTRIVGAVLYMLTFTFLGWIGVILMIIATAGSFPTLMRGGAIDLLVSKPISRSRLFLYKYLAGMVFVCLQAGVFVGATFLVMGLRWHVWVPGYLLSIPLLVLLFSYIYCVTVLVAVKTRSTVAAILLSLGAWFLFAAPTATQQLIDRYPSLKENTQFYRVFRIVRWIPPKTADIPYLGARWAQAGTSIDLFAPELMASAGNSDWREIDRARELEERELHKNPFLSIGSSLLFEAVIVLWAMSIFVRRDY